MTIIEGNIRRVDSSVDKSRLQECISRIPKKPRGRMSGGQTSVLVNSQKFDLSTEHTCLRSTPTFQKMNNTLTTRLILKDVGRRNSRVTVPLRL